MGAERHIMNNTLAQQQSFVARSARPSRNSRNLANLSHRGSVHMAAMDYI